MIEKLFDAIIKNLKNPRLYITILAFIVFALLLFPYLDANFLYYSRVNNRIDILAKANNIHTNELNNDVLREEYNNILNEISKQKDGSFGSIFRTQSTPVENFFKFISGAGLFWIFAIVCIFTKSINTFGKKIGCFLLLAVLGVVFGFIASALPIIVYPAINYICFPSILLILAGLLVTISNKRNVQGK